MTDLILSSGSLTVHQGAHAAAVYPVNYLTQRSGAYFQTIVAPEPASHPISAASLFPMCLSVAWVLLIMVIQHFDERRASFDPLPSRIARPEPTPAHYEADHCLDCGRRKPIGSACIACQADPARNPYYIAESTR